MLLGNFGSYILMLAEYWTCVQNRISFTELFHWQSYWAIWAPNILLICMSFHFPRNTGSRRYPAATGASCSLTHYGKLQCFAAFRSTVTKCAHNLTFERTVAAGFILPCSVQWLFLSPTQCVCVYVCVCECVCVCVYECAFRLSQQTAILFAIHTY